ncbi:MAG: hypothetical protein KatS3mg026_1170 [Bacteroidia bacterium]|nr:MAG: hypothetical protein KatS3mg026_1170 [Bacteroidia bacterium]
MIIATPIRAPWVQAYRDSAYIEVRERRIVVKGPATSLRGIATSFWYWEGHASQKPDKGAVEEDPVLRIQPRTPLAAALLRARRAYLEAGGKLLNWDELQEEIRQLRGGWEEK